MRPFADALHTGAIFGVVEAVTRSGWAIRIVAQLDRGMGPLDRLRPAAGSGCTGLESAARRRRADGAPRGTGLRSRWPDLPRHRREAAGVGLAFVEINILLVAAVIGLCTFSLVSIGHGRAWEMIGRRAEVVGGRC